jgi:hypothetical protein
MIARKIQCYPIVLKIYYDIQLNLTFTNLRFAVLQLVYSKCLYLGSMLPHCVETAVELSLDACIHSHIMSSSRHDSSKLPVSRLGIG